MSTWTDHHCHLPDEGASELVALAAEAGVTRLLDVGCDLASSVAARDRARRLAGSGGARVWSTAGVHPHEASGGIDGIEALLDDPLVVAVGECGLDYYYLHSPAEVQREAFAAQIALAHRHGMPLVIHSRSAWDDTFDVLAAEGVPERTVFHCFTGGPDEARRCLDVGASLSFSGIVSFPSAPEVREAAALCPADRYLVETDAPYLAPVPHRGRKNRPDLVVRVGEVVAEVRGVPASQVAAETSANAEAFYGLGPA